MFSWEMQHNFQSRKYYTFDGSIKEEYICMIMFITWNLNFSMLLIFSSILVSLEEIWFLMLMIHFYEEA